MKVILTGATGMVGEGVLRVCLEDPSVTHVLMVNRKPFKLQNSKLSECLVPSFFDLDDVADQLAGYDACFFCAGVSSAGMNEADYTRITYDLTLRFAEFLAGLNPSMTFEYISGQLTDSTEKGRTMWARVKGRTENALMKLNFKKVFCLRPGFMKPVEGQWNLKWYYTAIGALYPALSRLFPNHGCTLQQVGEAMIRCALSGYSKQVLEVADIKAASDAHTG